MRRRLAFVTVIAVTVLAPVAPVLAAGGQMT